MKLQKNVHIEEKIFTDFKKWCIDHYITVSKKVEQLMEETIKGK